MSPRWQAVPDVNVWIAAYIEQDRTAIRCIHAAEEAQCECWTGDHILATLFHKLTQPRAVGGFDIPSGGATARAVRPALELCRDRLIRKAGVANIEGVEDAEDGKVIAIAQRVSELTGTTAVLVTLDRRLHGAVNGALPPSVVAVSPRELLDRRLI